MDVLDQYGYEFLGIMSLQVLHRDGGRDYDVPASMLNWPVKETKHLVFTLPEGKVMVPRSILLP
jgi:hypothetical protein